MNKRIGILVVLLAAASMMCWAQTVTDPPLWIGAPAGTDTFAFTNYVVTSSLGPCPPGCADVNGLGTTGTVAVTAHGGSLGSDPAAGGLSPFWLIIGIPTALSTPLTPPQITNVDVWNTSSGSGTVTVGATPDLTSGAVSIGASLFVGPTFGTQASEPWTGSPQNDSYGALGFTQATAGNSESFGNWQTVEQTLFGVTVPAFELVAYDLTNYTNHTSFLAGGVVEATFGSSGYNLPGGTFVTAFGCNPFAVAGAQTCANGGAVYATPLTQTGLTEGGGGFIQGSPIPEPASIFLFGTVTLIITGFWRKKAHLS